MPPPLLVPVPLFTAAPNLKLVPNSRLQTALQAALTAIARPDKPANFGLTIIDVSTPGDGTSYGSAGVNNAVEHYAASMLKAGCLYAAYALLDLAQRFAAARKTSSDVEFFRKASSELDPQIEASCPMAQAGAKPVRLPRWRDVFAVSKNGASVQFAPEFKPHLKKMIVPSNNESAGTCIRGVGFAYLNGLMRKHGFFDDSGKTGIWLAGDFVGSETIKIPCVNDVDTKQGTTSDAMARLMAVVLLGKVLPAASHSEMNALFAASAIGGDSSYFSRTSMEGHFGTGKVTHGKIGLGNLKTKANVYSDVTMIADPIGKAGAFITCYTNIDYAPYSIQDVLWILRETLRVYQGAGGTQAPLPGGRVAPAATASP